MSRSSIVRKWFVLGVTFAVVGSSMVYADGPTPRRRVTTEPIPNRFPPLPDMIARRTAAEQRKERAGILTKLAFWVTDVGSQSEPETPMVLDLDRSNDRAAIAKRSTKPEQPEVVSNSDNLILPEDNVAGSVTPATNPPSAEDPPTTPLVLPASHETAVVPALPDVIPAEQPTLPELDSDSETAPFVAIDTEAPQPHQTAPAKTAKARTAKVEYQVVSPRRTGSQRGMKSPSMIRSSANKSSMATPAVRTSGGDPTMTQDPNIIQTAATQRDAEDAIPQLPTESEFENAAKNLEAALLAAQAQSNQSNDVDTEIPPAEIELNTALPELSHTEVSETISAGESSADDVPQERELEFETTTESNPTQSIEESENIVNSLPPIEQKVEPAVVSDAPNAPTANEPEKTAVAVAPELSEARQELAELALESMTVPTLLQDARRELEALCTTNKSPGMLANPPQPESKYDNPNLAKAHAELDALVALRRELEQSQPPADTAATNGVDDTTARVLPSLAEPPAPDPMPEPSPIPASAPEPAVSAPTETDVSIQSDPEFESESSTDDVELNAVNVPAISDEPESEPVSQEETAVEPVLPSAPSLEAAPDIEAPRVEPTPEPSGETQESTIEKNNLPTQPDEATIQPAISSTIPSESPQEAEPAIDSADAQDSETPSEETAGLELPAIDTPTPPQLPESLPTIEDAPSTPDTETSQNELPSLPPTLPSPIPNADQRITTPPSDPDAEPKQRPKEEVPTAAEVATDKTRAGLTFARNVMEQLELAPKPAKPKQTQIEEQSTAIPSQSDDTPSPPSALPPIAGEPTGDDIPQPLSLPSVSEPDANDTSSKPNTSEPSIRLAKPIVEDPNAGQPIRAVAHLMPPATESSGHEEPTEQKRASRSSGFGSPTEIPPTANAHQERAGSAVTPAIPSQPDARIDNDRAQPVLRTHAAKVDLNKSRDNLVNANSLDERIRALTDIARTHNWYHDAALVDAVTRVAASRAEQPSRLLSVRMLGAIPVPDAKTASLMRGLAKHDQDGVVRRAAQSILIERSAAKRNPVRP